MLLEQTEERGDFTIISCSRMYLPFLYSKITDEHIIFRREMLENKLTNTLTAHRIAANCQSKMFISLWHFHNPRFFMSDSQNYLQVWFLRLILEITRSALDMKVSECNSYDVRIMRMTC